ncbi:MAG TPA: permease-like cell division protein FtsX [Candidatus Micrarchaeaceae archaeon]|nr:permease-like cell division protein FtsX [Candidatus Micrarchaeaceae archaeon]
MGIQTATTKGARATNGVAAAHGPGANGTVAPSPVVKVTHVSKLFGKNAVLNNISISVAPGEILEVTGPSGSGKTTLLRLIHGQLRPNRGEIWVEGRGLHRWWRRGLGRIRRDVAFVYQDQRLLPRLTALENLIFAMQIGDPEVPHRTIKRRALDALEGLGLGHRRGAYPHQLSAGERQRVAVARALSGRPKVLLADEPLASIDDDNAKIVMRLLEDAAANGTAVVVATHRPTFAAHRVLRLPSGEQLVSRDRARSNGKHFGFSLWRRVAPATNRSLKNGHAVDARLPLWRRLIALVDNSFRMVVLSGLSSWARDLRLTAPALGSIAMTLVLCGMLALVGISTATVAGQQASQASIVRIYLANDASPSAVGALESRLRADSRVSTVTEISAEQALQDAENKPGLGALAGLTGSNPFSASLDVQVKQVGEVAAVAAEVVGDPAVDPTYPTSYDPNTYNRLRNIALVIGGIGGGLLLLFALVSYAVAANSMRAIAAARQNEVTVIRLLGARGWMVRGPFVTEGLVTGAFAGAVAAAAVLAVWTLASGLGSHTYSLVLPGVGPDSVRYVAAAVIVAGLALGALTAMLGFRRIRA